MKSSPHSRSIQVHKAMAHPARLRILAMLRDGELCVCKITEELGLAASTVSAHLKELGNAGLTAERKKGKWVNIGLAVEDDDDHLMERVLTRIEQDPQVLEDHRVVAQLMSRSSVASATNPPAKNRKTLNRRCEMSEIKLIEILGTGCPRCKESYRIVQQVVEQSGLNVEVRKDESINRMLELGILSSPAIVVDDEIKLTGQIPKAEFVQELLGIEA